MKFNKKEADLFAAQIRKNILKSIASKGKGHVGGSLSMADLLAVLYGSVMNIDPKHPEKEDRDYIVLSKGHAGPALYAVLAAKGYFPEATLETLNKNDTMLPSHTDRNKTPGVDVTTGSLGQGASLAAGIAFADALDGKNSRTFLILGDGELDEGQVWESALFVANQKLTNLITFVDANGKQLDGTTNKICNLGSIEKKFEAFGYQAISVHDGNNTQQIYDAIEYAKQNDEIPSVIVLHTKKGAGIKKYEEMSNCHSVAVSQQEYNSFIEELNKQFESIADGDGEYGTDN